VNIEFSASGDYDKSKPKYKLTQSNKPELKNDSNIENLDNLSKQKAISDDISNRNLIKTMSQVANQYLELNNENEESTSSNSPKNDDLKPRDFQSILKSIRYSNMKDMSNFLNNLLKEKQSTMLKHPNRNLKEYLSKREDAKYLYERDNKIKSSQFDLNKLSLEEKIGYELYLLEKLAAKANQDIEQIKHPVKKSIRFLKRNLAKPIDKERLHELGQTFITGTVAGSLLAMGTSNMLNPPVSDIVQEETKPIPAESQLASKPSLTKEYSSITMLSDNEKQVSEKLLDIAKKASKSSNEAKVSILDSVNRQQTNANVPFKPLGRVNLALADGGEKQLYQLVEVTHLAKPEDDYRVGRSVYFIEQDKFQDIPKGRTPGMSFTNIMENLATASVSNTINLDETNTPDQKNNITIKYSDEGSAQILKFDRNLANELIK
jgi:hypothetical protein